MTTKNNSAIVAPEIAVIDGKPTITSRQIAEDFEKSHRDVTRSIEKILEAETVSDESKQEYFQETEFSVEGQSRKYKQYILTKDGCAMVIMGYTGDKALGFKDAYIKAFNSMEADLLNSDRSISANQLKAIRDEVTNVARYMKHSGSSLACTLYLAMKKELGYEKIEKLPRSQFEQAMCFLRSYRDVSHQVYNYTRSIERQLIEMIRLDVKADDIDAVGMFNARASVLSLEETAAESAS